MATALSMVTRAMRLARVIGKGETLDSDESADGLTALNAMLDSWSIERLFVYSIRDETFSWAASQASRTVGAAGDFATDRPSRVDGSSYFVSGGINYGVELLSPEAFAGIQVPTTGSTIPIYLSADYTSSALVTLSAYPVPSATISFHLRTWRLLQSFAALTTTLALPPGYQRAIEYSLAEEFGPEFGKDTPPQVMRIAAKARANIKRINAPSPVLVSEVAYMNTGPRSENIYAG